MRGTRYGDVVDRGPNSYDKKSIGYRKSNGTGEMQNTMDNVPGPYGAPKEFRYPNDQAATSEG